MEKSGKNSDDFQSQPAGKSHDMKMRRETKRKRDEKINSKPLISRFQPFQPNVYMTNDTHLAERMRVCHKNDGFKGNFPSCLSDHYLFPI